MVFMMKTYSVVTPLLVIAALLEIATFDFATVAAFSAVALPSNCRRLEMTTSGSLLATSTTMAESGIPAASSEPDSDVTDVTIPTNLPSECGMDYVPLASMLATGQLAEADQVSKRKTN
jgi:hypothetical protein